MRQRTYYLSGPMRGKPGCNYDTFNEAAAALQRHDGAAFVFNPAANFGGDTTRHVTEYMRTDVQQVSASDFIVLLPGWESSEGAKVEVTVARACGLEFLLATKEDGAWIFRSIQTPAPTPASPRGDILDEAKALITGDRNNAYGPPTQDFSRTAGMASAFGFQVNGEPLKGHHVAIFMILLKMSRLAWTPRKRDSWVDTGGYAGCGYECAMEEN